MRMFQEEHVKCFTPLPFVSRPSAGSWPGQSMTCEYNLHSRLCERRGICQSATPTPTFRRFFHPNHEVWRSSGCQSRPYIFSVLKTWMSFLARLALNQGPGGTPWRIPYMIDAPCVAERSIAAIPIRGSVMPIPPKDKVPRVEVKRIMPTGSHKLGSTD